MNAPTPVIAARRSSRSFAPDLAGVPRGCRAVRGAVPRAEARDFVNSTSARDSGIDASLSSLVAAIKII
jgi:hypothetical protein